MKDIDSRRLAMFRRLYVFGLNRRDAFATGSAGSNLFRHLERTIATIETEQRSQFGGHVDAHGGKIRRAGARAELLAQLTAIRATTRARAKQRRDARTNIRLTM